MEEILDLNGQEVAPKIEKLKELQPEAFHKSDTGYSWDTHGMAMLFAELYNEETRYCPETKSWYTYDSGAWRKDLGALLVSRKIKVFVTILNVYCLLYVKDEDKQKSFKKFLLRTGDRPFRDHLMKDAQDELIISASDFDKDPNLVNCLNGTYDLDTMTFREHNWQDFITLQANFSYSLQDNTECERWERFIKEITSYRAGDKLVEDPEKADYIQKALGYSLLGSNKEECMFIIHGKSTRNGKSTLVEAVSHILGDYSDSAPVSLICKTHSRNAESASPTLAKLKGKRFVTMSESEYSGKLDESALKQYTGGEEITARNLYEAPITFLPQFTMWLTCNDLPAVEDKSLFASDRLRVVEFNRHFSREERDKDLKEFFRTDKAKMGIFDWLVRGFMKYKRFGLNMPERLQKIINQYERDNDVILQFLEEKCERNPNGKIQPKILYDTFRRWCRKENYHTCSNRKFYEEVEAHPDWVERKAKITGEYYFIGLTFKSIC